MGLRDVLDAAGLLRYGVPTSEKERLAASGALPGAPSDQSEDLSAANRYASGYLFGQAYPTLAPALMPLVNRVRTGWAGDSPELQSYANAGLNRGLMATAPSPSPAKKYKIRNPKTGKVYAFSQPPTDDDIDEAFASEAPLGPPLRQTGETPYYSVPPVRPEHFDISTPEGAISSALGAASGVVGAPGLAAGLARGAIGAGIGAHAGKWIGSGIGLPEEGATVGKVVGGLAGGFKPSALAGLAKAGWHGGGVGPALLRALIGEGGVAGRGAITAPPIAATVTKAAPIAEPITNAAVQLAKQGTFRTYSEALAFLKSLDPKSLAAAMEQLAGKVAPAAEGVIPSAAGRVAKAVGSATAQAAKPVAPSLMTFAEEVAATNPKVGAKIWVELAKDGTPLRHLTPDQAAAATKAGKNVTWVKNLWSKGSSSPTIQGPPLPPPQQ